MTIINIIDNKITSTSCDLITSGSVNYNYVTFKFSPQWGTLNKIATFKVNEIEYSVSIKNDQCMIPWEALVISNAGYDISIGVIGTKGQTISGMATYQLSSKEWFVSVTSEYYNDFLGLKIGDNLSIGGQEGWTNPMTIGTIGNIRTTENGMYFGLENQTGVAVNNATAVFGFTKQVTVITTPYSVLGKILLGADGSGSQSINPTLPIWADLQNQIGNLNDLQTTDKNNLVDAINEVKTSGDKNFVYSQLSASDTWYVNHNLNKYPSVTVADSANSIVIGDVLYVDLNSVIIKFSSAFSGVAYFN